MQGIKMSKTVVISNNDTPKHNEHEVKGKTSKTFYGGTTL